MGRRNHLLTTLVTAAVMVLSASLAGAVYADEPDAFAIDGNGAKYIKPDSPDDPAVQAKLTLAATYEIYAATGIWDQSSIALLDSPESAPPTYKTLDTDARSQFTSYYCGPASGQVVINYSRGYTDPSLNGQDSSTNYKIQSVIAGTMKTTDPAGTDGDGVRDGLNEYVLDPYAGWVYVYLSATDGAQFHSWAVADIGGSEMPLIPGVKPHKPDQGNPEYYLPNWQGESTAKHWIVIRGYDGFWDGTDTPRVYYSDSTHTPGRYVTGAKNMWKVTQFLWGGTAVW